MHGKKIALAAIDQGVTDDISLKAAPSWVEQDPGLSRSRQRYTAI